MLIPLALRVGRPRQLIHLAGWAAAVIVAFLYVFPLKSTFPNDFWQFWIVGRAHTFMALRDIYGPTDSVRIALEAKRRVDPAQSEFEKRMRESYTAVDVVSTPLLFTIYGRLSSENFLHDYDIYRYLCAVVYLAGLLAFASYLRFPSWTFPVLAWFYTMPFWPFRRDVIDGNNSALVAGTAMGALVVLARPRPSARVAAGVILGFLATFKPTVLYAPMLICLLFALNDLRSFVHFSLGIAAGALLGFLIPVLTMPSAYSWLSWRTHSVERAFEIRSFSGGLLGRYFMVEHAFWYALVGGIALTAFCGYVWTLFRHAPRSNRLPTVGRPPFLDAILIGSAGLGIYLLTGMLVWGHYFTLAIPLSLISLRPRPDRDDAVIIRAVGVLASLLLALHQKFREWEWTDWGSYSPFTLAGVAILLAIAIWDLGNTRARNRADQI